MGVLDLPRSRRDPAPTLHAPTHRRGRLDHFALPLRAGAVPGHVHPQLDLPVRFSLVLELAPKRLLMASFAAQVLHRRYRRPDRHLRRARPDRPLRRLLLQYVNLLLLARPFHSASGIDTRATPQSTSRKSCMVSGSSCPHDRFRLRRGLGADAGGIAGCGVLAC